MNLTTISGNVGKDPELRMTQSGMKVSTYSLAVNRANPKDKDKPITDWFTVVAWGDQADLVVKTLKKGTRVLVNGRFQTRQYENSQGQKVNVTELMQNDFWVAPKAEDNGSIFDDSDLPF